MRVPLHSPVSEASYSVATHSTGDAELASLNGAWAVLNPQGEVLRLDPSLTRWLKHSDNALGQPLVALASQREPGWKVPLDELLEAGEHPATRSLCDTAATPHQWYDCEAVPGPECRFLRFTATLPPVAELRESAWDEHLRSDAARRQLLFRLLRAESQMESLSRRWPGVIFSQRADFSFSFASARIHELTGLSPEDLRSQTSRFWQLIHEGDVAELQTLYKRLDTKNPTLSVTYRLRHAITGRVSYILEQREASFTESGFLLGYEGIWLDVTRQTIAERRLSSAAWKETLAVLTIGLAHDFSNIMAGIHSLSESFGVQLGNDHPFNEGLALIRQNAMQASQLVRRILSLHHDKVGEQNYSNLNEIVADTVELMHKTIPRRVQVKMQLASETLPLYVDAVELRQVLINLAVNSVDAMPNGGELSLTTSLHPQLPAETLRVGQVGRLPAVCLEVKDTGTGISASYLAMIFDPFFTTKAVNKGSGLGLYNARLFVEKHHGAISVDSVEGKGTTFRLWLPQADFTENDQVSTAGLPVRHTILLLGSPGQQLNRTTEYLRQHGFYVIVSVSAESAHEALGNPQCQLGAALVLCDGRQPWMLSLLTEMQQTQPTLKTAIQIIGCNIDELNPQALAAANLIISSDTSPNEILARLQTLLSAANTSVS